MPEQLTDEMQQGIVKAEAFSGGLAIRNTVERVTAMSGLRAVKVWQKKVTAWFKPTIDAAHAAHKAVVAQKRSITDRLDVCETDIKRAINNYDHDQEQIRAKEQRRLQAIANEAARKERERLLKRAAALKTEEKKEEALEQAAEVVASVVQVAAPEKQKGESTSQKWRARITDEKAIPREWMIVNEKALNAFARSTKGKVPVAGVEFYSESVLSVRA